LKLLINNCQKQTVVVHSRFRLELHDIFALSGYHAAYGGNVKVEVKVKVKVKVEVEVEV
jgi:hypothetical protein